MGRVFLYTTAGCLSCATARALVRSWNCVFYEISLSDYPERWSELEELGVVIPGVPLLFLNSDVLQVSQKKKKKKKKQKTKNEKGKSDLLQGR